MNGIQTEQRVHSQKECNQSNISQVIWKSDENVMLKGTTKKSANNKNKVQHVKKWSQNDDGSIQERERERGENHIADKVCKWVINAY